MKSKSRRKSCGNNNNNTTGPMSTCNEYKQLANDKCQKAECINNRANKIAQQAQAAEERAECLKQQAIEECRRANELWEEYDRLANEGICLMQQAQACLAKGVECYEDLYDDVQGCNLEDYGYNATNNINNNTNNNQYYSNNNNCSGNKNCGCNKNCGR